MTIASNPSGIATRTSPLVLTGSALTLEDVVDVARRGRGVALAPEALARVDRTRALLERLLDQGALVYGVNTGGGSLKRHQVSPEEMDAFNNRVRGFGSFGPELPADTVRAMLLARANALMTGVAGVRPVVPQALAAVLNANIVPVVHAIGTVSEADVGPQFEAGGVIRGLGQAWWQGQRLEAEAALAAAGLQPLRLREKERQALTNANTLATGLGALVVHDAMRLVEGLCTAGALSLEAFAGNPSIVDPAVERAHPFPGQARVAGYQRRLLGGSYITREEGPRNVLQDPLSFRCMPQTIGAACDAVVFARKQVEIELNADCVNAIIDEESGRAICHGNFDAVAVGNALDFMRVALAHALGQATTRILKLLNTHFSGLRTGLAPADGPWGSDLLMIEHTAAAAAAEIRFLAGPATLDMHWPVSEGVEDHASMAALSARVTRRLLDLGLRLVAVELLVAAQAVDVRGASDGLGVGTRAAYRVVRELVPPLPINEAWTPRIEELEERVVDGMLTGELRSSGATFAWG